MLDQRKKKILAAVIENYILHAEPVGSKRLVDEYNFNISSATMRHELATLEEMGYLVQPHPSAGRIPTDQGYRFYVDALVGTVPLPDYECNFINQFYSKVNREFEHLLRQTSALLSQLTSYAALVFSPALKIDHLKRVDLVLLSPKLVLMVAITSSGSVLKRVIEIDWDCEIDELNRYENILNDKFKGLSSGKIKQVDFNFNPVSNKVLLVFQRNLIELIAQKENEKVYHNGTINLLFQPEFESLNRVQKLISTLEQSYLLLELLSDVAQQYRLVVKIGAENGLSDIEGCSLVATPYGFEGEILGALGILGPTRMNYSRAIPTVQYIADNLSNLLESMHKRG